MPPHGVGPVQVQGPIGVPDPFRGLDRFHRQVGRRRIFVQTDSGDVLDVEVDRADTAEKVKKAVQATLCVPTEQSNLLFGGHVLEDLSEVRKDTPVLLSRGISRSCSSPCLSPSVHITCCQEASKPLEAVGGASCSSQVQVLLRDAVKAITAGVNPVRATGGLGGAYYFRNRRGESIAIVKPTDEEPFAPNNPNGYVGRALGQPGLKRTIRVGEGGVREVAAYLLDHGRFARVPHTALVKATHPVLNVNDDDVKATRDRPPTKLASFQQYVKHDFDASEVGTSRFPVSPIHRIGILDIRIFNTDRHSGNILVRRLSEEEAAASGGSVRRVDEAVELIPIDHGFCLPETLESAYFEWLHWPQASLPFSQEELEYIKALDVEKDVEKLRAELPKPLPEGCLRVLILSTMLLQRAAADGFNLSEIGSMMSRELRGMDEEASELETICYTAKERLEEEILQSSLEARSSVDGSTGEADEEDDLAGVQFQFEDEDFTLQLGSEMRHPLEKAVSSKFSNGDDTSTESDTTSSLFGSGGTFGFSSSSSPLSMSRSGTPPLLRLEETRPLDEELLGSPTINSTLMSVKTDKLISAQYKTVRPKITCPKRPSTFHSRSFNYDRPARSLVPQSPMQRCPPNIFSACHLSSKSPRTSHTSDAELLKAFPPEGGFNFGDMSESLWQTYVNIVREVMDEALAKKKQAMALRGKRLGMSCKF